LNSLVYSLLKKTVDFFLYSSLFIACCAVVMSYQSFVLFGFPVNTNLLYFAFFGTISSYNFHWLLTPAQENASGKAYWHLQRKPFHYLLFLIGVIGSAYFGLQLLAYWPWLTAIAVITFFYSAPKVPLAAFRQLKKIAVAKTAFLTLVWTYVTAMLPLLIHTTQWRWEQHLYIFNRFFFIYAICILFDDRDKEADRLEGIRSLVTHLTDKGIAVIFWLSLVVTLLSNILIFDAMPFPIALSFLIPLAILALLYLTIKRNTSDYYFYLVLDGLMMLSGLILILLIK
jgi:hypothetical protein